MGIIRHLGLVDGDAVNALDATNRGTPGGRKRGRDDDASATRTTQSCGELCGDVSPKGRVQLLVDDTCLTGQVRHLENALRREAGGRGAGIGIEGYGVEVICEYLRRAEKHGGPVTGVDELDAGVRGAGQIIGDYSDEHVSTSAFQVSRSEMTPSE
jgi:hypothetical protein